MRTTLDDSGSLVVKKLAESGSVLVASPLQLVRQGQPASISDLAGMDTVAMTAVDGRATMMLQGPDGTRHTLVHQPRYVADDLLTLKFAALQGTGMCFLPEYMCSRELADGRLVRVLPGWAPPRGIFHAVYPSRRGMVPAVRRFLDFLGEHTGQEGMPRLPAGCPSMA